MAARVAREGELTVGDVVDQPSLAVLGDSGSQVHAESPVESFEVFPRVIRREPGYRGDPPAFADCVKKLAVKFAQ